MVPWGLFKNSIPQERDNDLEVQEIYYMDKDGQCKAVLHVYG